MKKIFVFIAMLLATTLSAQVSVSTDGSSPDPSAMLEVKSTDKGLLIPRLTTVQRTGISNPAVGLLVYDSTTESFWFYNSGGWTELVSGSLLAASFIQDADGDTKIQTEKNADEDMIRFDLGGTEKMVLQGDRLEVLGSNNNLFIGKEAGLANLTGYNNTAVGHYSLNSNTTGYANVAIGNKALFLNTDRRDLVAIGDMALYNNGSGATGDMQALINTAVGSKTLMANTTGSFNTGLGGFSLYHNTTGTGNSTNGFCAMHYNTSGSYNSASGYNALYNNTGGQYNSAMGNEALFYINNANYNSSLGNQSLYNNHVGNNNTALGNQAGYSNINGSNNIFIGNKAGYNETGSNRLYIDVSETSSPLIWGDFSNSLLNINGSLGIGTTNPLNKLHIVATSDPLRLEGLQETIEDTVLVVASDGVVSKRPVSGLAGDPSWSLTGNAGTDPATDFIGTTDYKPLNFRVNGQPAGIIHPVSGNTIFGYQTFLSNTSGVYNSGYGQWSLYANTSGSYNSAFGRYSLMNNTEGAFNSAFGDGSLAANQSGSYNTAYGAGSIASNLNGYGNAAVGESTLGFMTNGNYNTAIGKEALLYNITGSKNVAIGYHAGYHETEDNRLYIDNDAHADLADGREKSLIYGVFDADPANQKLALNANVGIGTIDPLNKLHVVAEADPLRLEGLQESSDSEFLVVDEDGVVSKKTADGWSLTGNSGTDPATNFIGTLDSVPLTFRVNDKRSGIIDPGLSNISLGYKTLDSNITGANNSAFGNYALRNNVSGIGNTGIGSAALVSNISGYYNVAVGNQALNLNSDGDMNVAIGFKAMLDNTVGYYNTAIGTYALNKNKANIGNTAVGYNAMYNANDRTNGLPTHNTAIGSSALKGSTTPANNTGKYNSAMGSSSLFGNSSGEFNTAVGSSAMRSNADGNKNTAIGSNALYNNINGTGNVALGNEAGFYETGSNKLYIGNSNMWDPLVYGVFDSIPANQKLTFNANVGINTTVPDSSAALDVSSTTKGFLPPRMTVTQRDLIANPAEGLIIYNTSLDKFEYYNGSAWKTVISTTSSSGSSAEGSGFCSEGVTDYDGHHYKSVKIGDQCWMAENLKSTHYSTGAAISEAYAYDNQESYALTYGRLYTWAAVMNGAASSNANPSGVQGVCPSGWHVPSDNEWKELEMTIGMSQTEADAIGWRGTHGEGKKLKETDDAFLWETGSQAGNNASGFSGLPGAYHQNGGFHALGSQGYWWTSTGNTTNALSRYLGYDDPGVGRYSYFIEDLGFSVRCLRD